MTTNYKKLPRSRGVTLTFLGRSNLLQAIRNEEFDRRLTIEELSHRVGFDPGTMAKILDARHKVDKRTLERCFQSFNLTLTESDYASPGASEIGSQDIAAVLSQGTSYWHQWRLENPHINLVLIKADLSGIDLSAVDLRDADLSRAILVRTDLRGAMLNNVNLSKADLTEADLSKGDLRESKLIGADLSSADLSGADLREVDLSGADLSGADLSGANLIGANLRAVRALGTDFSGALLTGTCLEDWNINRGTKLHNVSCDYIYLKNGFHGRLPSDPNTIFAPGEFVQLFQKALETVDLIFADGINWQAFFQSFQELRSQYDNDNLSIQAIEKKSDGAFVIRLDVPPEVDKGAIESQAKELYERDRQLLETQYRERLQAKDREIEIYKQQHSSMEEIAKLLATRPIHIESRVVEANNNMPQENLDLESTD
jgi:uncharacterized protein YjbI with pentapeptide repeats